MNSVIMIETGDKDSDADPTGFRLTDMEFLTKTISHTRREVASCHRLRMKLDTHTNFEEDTKRNVLQSQQKVCLCCSIAGIRAQGFESILCIFKHASSHS